MCQIRAPRIRDGILVGGVLLLVSACQTSGGAEGPSTPDPSGSPPTHMIQAGAPGQESRNITAGEASRAVFPTHTAADLRFMQDMIHHHAQALELSALVPDRSQWDDLHLMARRIQVSQNSEIALMARWLQERGAEVPEMSVWSQDGSETEHGGHHEHGSHDALQTQDGSVGMPGMLSPLQMAELEALSGEEFDSRFLEFMIFHHQGAIRMVADLLASPGAAQAGGMFEFASHVDSDQRMEIDRMSLMLQELHR